MILTAEIDLEVIIKSKLDFDPIGHYSRPDIFEFNVKTEGLPMGEGPILLLGINLGYRIQ